MRLLLRIVLVPAMVMFLSANASAIGLEVAVGGWSHEIEGELSYKSVFPDDLVNLEDEAGYDKEEKPFGRAKLDLPVVPNLYFMATPMEFEGNGSKTNIFNFGDVTIDAPFYSKAKLDHYDLALYYGVPLTGLASLGTVGIDLGINVRMLEVDMVVRETVLTGGEEDSVDETLYIPMGYLALQLMPTDRLSFEGEVRGVAYSDNHYYDLIARLKYRILGPAFAAAGWRYEDLSIDEEDVRAEITISGPFVEAGMQF